MTAYHDETENLMASAPARKGNWMQTFTGRQFWPADPRADEIDIRDIAHALSMQCRYAGHCTQFYSVAEHCVLLANAIPEQKLWALLHDASAGTMPEEVAAGWIEGWLALCGQQVGETASA